ncbi:MAG: hypothetical protein H6899_09755 [Rhodobacter sp.]|nr:hypothetical protein [Rhodobacter sp.]
MEEKQSVSGHSSGFTDTSHPEGVDRESRSSSIPPSAVDYWIRQRHDARMSMGRESHAAHNLSLQIPAQQGPMIAIGASAAVSFSDVSLAGGIVVLLSALLIISSSAVSLYLLFRKYHVIVSIVDHVDAAKVRFARGEVPVSELYLVRGGHLFKGLDRFFVILATSLYILGLVGIAAGFAVSFFFMPPP